MINQLADRMVGALVPKATAAAGSCWIERCCNYKFCRQCCFRQPGISCDAWDYC